MKYFSTFMFVTNVFVYIHLSLDINLFIWCTREKYEK